MIGDINNSSSFFKKLLKIHKVKADSQKWKWTKYLNIYFTNRIFYGGEKEENLPYFISSSGYVSQNHNVISSFSQEWLKWKTDITTLMFVRVGATGTVVCCCRKVNWYNHFGKYLLKLNIHILYDAIIPPLGIYHQKCLHIPTKKYIWECS